MPLCVGGFFGKLAGPVTVSQASFHKKLGPNPALSFQRLVSKANQSSLLYMYVVCRRLNTSRGPAAEASGALRGESGAPLL